MSLRSIVFFTLSFLASPACSPRADEPEHDVVIIPASDSGELRLALTGAAPSADALGVGVFLHGPPPVRLLGSVEGSPAPGTDSVPRVSQPLRDVRDERPDWDAWQTDPMPLHEAGRLWTTASLEWGREPGSSTGFRAARYPEAWFGLEDWEWCEPAPAGGMECISLETAYYQRRFSCWSLGEPVDCRIPGADGTHDLLIPHVIARAWVGEEVPSCALDCDWLGLEDLDPAAEYEYGPDAAVRP